MRLDGLTLLVAGCFVAGLAAVLLSAAWAGMRNSPALLWWACGHAVNGIAAAAFAVGLVTLDPVAAVVGGGAIVLSMALYWTGALAFTGKKPSPWAIVAASAAWAAAAIPATGGGARASVVVAFVLTAVFLCLASATLWEGRAERLAARWPLAAIFLIHALFMTVGAIEIVTGRMEIEASPSLLGWFGVIHFERLVFLIGSAIFMVMVARERRELRSIAAARVDYLTGVANRGAFFVQAERVFRRARQDGAPFSLVVFDLDRFKSINDTFGHAVGDRVLRSFAEVAAAVLRPGDLFGRIGGEEFAAVLPGAGAEAAYVIADRVRQSFEAVPKTLGGTVHATVSAGVATAGSVGTLETTLEAADRALYRAKEFGRNRVERAGDMRPPAASNLIRVA